MNPDGLYCAFFYGTLMHPDILKRVIGNDGTHLKICSGILLVRHSFYRNRRLCAPSSFRSIETNGRVLFLNGRIIHGTKLK